MFVNCERLSEGVYQFNCNLCGCPICTEGTDYLEYIIRTRDRPFCFECEGVDSTTFPDLFKNYWDYFWFFGATTDDIEPACVVLFNPHTGVIDSVEYDWFWSTFDQVDRQAVACFVKPYFSEHSISEARND